MLSFYGREWKCSPLSMSIILYIILGSTPFNNIKRIKNSGVVGALKVIMGRHHNNRQHAQERELLSSWLLTERKKDGLKHKLAFMF